jgi:hypothetical protein
VTPITQKPNTPIHEGGHGAVPKRHADHEEADGVVPGVTQEVERIGVQRCRARRHAGRHLDGEHGRVDEEHDPQNAAIAFVSAMDVVWLIAAGGAHDRAVFSRQPLREALH